MAPVTAEYVPAKEKRVMRVRVRRFEDKRFGELTKGEGEKVGGENTFYSTILVSKWDKVVREEEQYR